MLLKVGCLVWLFILDNWLRWVLLNRGFGICIFVVVCCWLVVLWCFSGLYWFVCWIKFCLPTFVFCGFVYIGLLFVWIVFVFVCLVCIVFWLLVLIRLLFGYCLWRFGLRTLLGLGWMFGLSVGCIISVVVVFGLIMFNCGVMLDGSVDWFVVLLIVVF